MKYIVTYFIIRLMIIVCPEAEVDPDEFGRLPAIRIQTSEGCYKYDTVKMEKHFDIRKEATDFIKRGTTKENSVFTSFGTGSLHGFKLDSISLIQYNCTHMTVFVTMMGCPSEPCNTATCHQCGKQWATY